VGNVGPSAIAGEPANHATAQRADRCLRQGIIGNSVPQPDKTLMVLVVLKASRVAIEFVSNVPKAGVTLCAYFSRTCKADPGQHSANPARRGRSVWPVWQSSMMTKQLRSNG
jgi:hypothetical protein